MCNCYNQDIMNIFKTILKSLYGKEFYAGLVNKSTKESMWYLSKLLLLTAVISTVIFSVISISFIRQTTSEEGRSKILEKFPSELAISIKDQKFSTNVKEPYTLNFSEKKDGDLSDMVIETKLNSVSYDEFVKYHTSVLLIKDSVAALNKGVLEVKQVAKGMPDFTLDKKFAEEKLAWASGYAQKSIWYLPIAIYIFVYLWGLNYLVTNVFVALFVWGLLAILKKDINYKHAYRVSMYASTLPLIISAFIPINFLPTLVLTLIMVFVNFQSKKEVVNQA